MNHFNVALLTLFVSGFIVGLIVSEIFRQLIGWN